MNIKRVLLYFKELRVILNRDYILIRIVIGRIWKSFGKL